MRIRNQKSVLQKREKHFQSHTFSETLEENIKKKTKIKKKVKEGNFTVELIYNKLNI